LKLMNIRMILIHVSLIRKEQKSTKNDSGGDDDVRLVQAVRIRWDDAESSLSKAETAEFNTIRSQGWYIQSAKICTIVLKQDVVWTIFSLQHSVVTS
jgi:hypothetical protein